MAKNRYHKTAGSSASSFQRSRGQAPGSSILVVTEGVNTEPIYFNELRKHLAAPTVELVAYGEGTGDPRVLVDAALKLQAERRKKARNKELSINQLEGFDQMWIVFDTDVLKRDKLFNGITYAESKGVLVASSEPCFEFWLLLHEETAYTTALMPKCADVIPHLKATFNWKSWDKNKAEALSLLPKLASKARIRTAAKSAARVRKHHEDCRTEFPANPSTEIDLLIQAINEAVGPANKFL